MHKAKVNPDGCHFLLSFQSFLIAGSERQPDIVFNQNKTKIIASRFFVQLKGIQNFDDFGQTMQYLWKICDFYKEKYDVRVYHPVFKWSEQVNEYCYCTVKIYIPIT